MRKRVLKISAVILGIAAVAIVAVCLWARSQIMGSLAQLDGERPVHGISSEIKVERDSLGIPTIHASSRKDLAFATGFLHAQDRFFQMDLLRRNSAGELAELAGPDVAAADTQVRVNRFRDVARRVVDKSSGQEREVLLAYADGVNAGLDALDTKPFEYLLLGAKPAPWKPEDSVLVMFSMYLDLQGPDFQNESRLGLMHDVLPGPMFEFLAPRGTEWDAPMQGEAFAVAPIPGPDVFDTRKQNLVARADLNPTDRFSDSGIGHLGSNNWALSGKHTADGRAFVANDMHLGIRVPHIWYRASFVWHDDPKDKQEHRITGVSLPGAPVMIVGSNGHVAWGFTNSQGDWVDVVLIDVDPNDKDSYLTPKGPRKFDHHEEIIKVKGAPDVVRDVVSTIWGPVVDHDYKDRPRVLRWVAHDTDGVNMGLVHIESAATLEEAMRLANLTGSPAQNFVVADDKGRIGWTIMGRIPRRVGFEGRLPTSWADGKHRWDGYLKPEEYPKIVDPADGRIWTANARVVAGDDLAKMGDGFYDLGARARQIRDDLKAVDKAKESDMLKIQLDDRALFLVRWQKLLLDTLTSEAIKADPRRGELKKLVENWGGHASIDSVGFRAVRAFRLHLITELSDVLVSPCKKYDKNFSIAGLDRTEGPVWRLVSERPAHLIDPRFKDWNSLLLAAADDVIDRATKNNAPLSDFTWGRFNTTRIHHPLSAAVSAAASWLDMPAHELAGDSDNMPRIQAPAMGASERMTVSPGHESDGYLHMPCGQSGHPFSSNYADELAAWEEGKPTPFLPGATVHTLVLKPAA
jgi:penicillin G amidase